MTVLAAETAMILNVLPRSSRARRKTTSSVQNCETWLIVRAASWHLRYPLSCRDLESIFAERGFKSKNRVAFQSAPAHFDALTRRARLQMGHKAHHCGRLPI